MNYLESIDMIAEQIFEFDFSITENLIKLFETLITDSTLGINTIEINTYMLKSIEAIENNNYIIVFDVLMSLKEAIIE